MIAPSHINTENMSLPVDVRHPKTSFLKLRFGNLQIIIISIIIMAFLQFYFKWEISLNQFYF